MVTSSSVTVTPVGKTTGETVDISAYYDMTKFDFKSDNDTATWIKTEVKDGTGKVTTPAGWTLSKTAG